MIPGAAGVGDSEEPTPDSFCALSVMANVFDPATRAASFVALDSSSFKRQESIFVVLNLVVLSSLLLIHTLFSQYFGIPPPLLLIVLAGGFLVNVIELIWMQGAIVLSGRRVVAITWATILLNMSLAFTLASLSYRQDAQYFALLVAPVFQAAFRLSALATISVVAASTALDFFWVWNYFRVHPPSQSAEYMEAGTISLIYAIMAALVWNLVNYLRTKEADLTASLVELDEAREKLLAEEKLAAVGRLSSAIAHEIRNPVAMISSALATAFSDGADSPNRQEMFEIAAKEAARLEKLTTDFLVYARPRPPDRQLCDAAESIAYAADICSPRSMEAGVTIQADAGEGLLANIDAGQIQQAILNLVINAVDATPRGGLVSLRGTQGNGVIGIHVENGNGPIPSEVVEQIFEPFFTTKPSGTGLGLAIARNIARGHGGDLALSRNAANSIRFSITLPAYTGKLEAR